MITDAALRGGLPWTKKMATYCHTFDNHIPVIEQAIVGCRSVKRRLIKEQKDYEAHESTQLKCSEAVAIVETLINAMETAVANMRALDVSDDMRNYVEHIISEISDASEQAETLEELRAALGELTIQMSRYVGLPVLDA